MGAPETLAGLAPDQLDQSVQLYAAVARTLSGSDQLDSVYPVKHASLTIPAKRGTVRGLILVFTQENKTGMPPLTVTRLIATTDPEIKNGVGAHCDQDRGCQAELAAPDGQERRRPL